ncbi:MAG: ABC transporter substrate-binding protein, partial [Dehalococcoidia bacterium]
TAEDQPIVGGIITDGCNSSQIPTFDGHRGGSSSNGICPLAKFYNGLVENYDADILELALAESWDFSDDGTTLTFKLRPGVKFHNGKTMDAEDVKYSILKMAGVTDGVPSSRTGNLKEYLVLGDEVTVIDDLTVQLNLQRPSDAPLWWLATVPGAIFPAEYTADEASKEPIGTGPFTLTEYVKGSHMITDRFNDYFKPGKPYVDGVYTHMISDKGTFQAAFLAGRMDVIHWSYPFSLQNQPMVQKMVADGDVELMMGWAQVLQGLAFNVTDTVFSDVRMRRAFSLAIDRDGMLAAVYDSRGAPRILFAGEPWGRSEEEIRALPGWRQPKDDDIAEAKRLLAEAGYAEGLDVDLITRDSSTYVAFTEYYAGELAKIGVNAAIRQVDTATQYDLGAAGEFQIISQRFAMASGHPDEVVGGYFITGASRNYFQYSNPVVDELFLEMSGELDPIKKRSLIREIEDILLEDVPMAFTADAEMEWGTWSYIKGYKMPITKYMSSYTLDQVWIVPH